MGILCRSITVNMNGSSSEGEFQTSGTNTSGVTAGSRTKVFAQLFDGKVPSSMADKQWVDGYMTTFNVGGFNVTVHKKVANDVKNILNDIIKSGYTLKSVGSYKFRTVNNGTGSKTLSMHASGAALDINACADPMKKGYYINGFNKVGLKSDPNDPNDMNPGRIRNANHTVVQIFKKYGWGWGGRYKDYMHFSIANGC